MNSRLATPMLVMLATAALARPVLAQTSSTDDAAQRLIERRAVEAVIWGMPAVNFELMVQAAVDARAGWNKVVYWSRLPDWKNQTLTPNPGTIYLMPFYNTKEGPVVLEIPPATEGSITGSIDDAWQTALEDVGPAGVDQGKGGKYLILPPGYQGSVPAGYIELHSSTYTGFALLRSELSSNSAADVAKAVAYGKRVKLYPLKQAAHPPLTVFVDVINMVFDSTIPYDVRFFRMLDRVVQREPWLERDRAMIDPLKSVGIEKGKPFAPDAKTQALLTQAAAEAHGLLDAKYESFFIPPYFPGTHWNLPVPKDMAEGVMSNYANPNSYPVDARGTAYSFAFFSTKHLGTGQYYLFAARARDGDPFDGGANYHLRVPPKAPVRLYWSATAYDRDTHALIRDVKVAGRTSREPELKKNADGSVDIWFGPTAPPGNESNWIPTKAGRRFEVLFRLYGPEKPLFDKTWKLADVEKVK